MVIKSVLNILWQPKPKPYFLFYIDEKWTLSNTFHCHICRQIYGPLFLFPQEVAERGPCLSSFFSTNINWPLFRYWSLVGLLTYSCLLSLKEKLHPQTGALITTKQRFQTTMLLHNCRLLLLFVNDTFVGHSHHIPFKVQLNFSYKVNFHVSINRAWFRTDRI